jgi:dUTP pyrophosphatase
MNRVAEFRKVSYEQFKEGYIKNCGEAPDEEVRAVYERIKLPRRATAGSAGYDFFTTADITLEPGEIATIPTGVRCLMESGWVLMLFPRSGLGFKFRLQLNNTVGVIDSDYADSDNEGHIFVRITNDSKEKKTLLLKEGEAFVQGVLMPFGITYDDDVSEARNGGFGSTSR